MFGTALSSFTTFFATIGPIEAAVLFAALTPNATNDERRRLAVTATLIASAILAGSALLGGPLLHQLGVTIAALQTAGGIILLVLGLEMVFAKPTSMFKLTPPEGAEAQTKDDLAVFPLATPLLAGPGAMSAAILLAAQTRNDALQLTAVLLALAAVMAVTLALLLGAHRLSRVIGITAQRVLMRVFGILLAAIAVQPYSMALLPVACWRNKRHPEKILCSVDGFCSLARLIPRGAPSYKSEAFSLNNNQQVRRGCTASQE